MLRWLTDSSLEARAEWVEEPGLLNEPSRKPYNMSLGAPRERVAN